MARASACGAGFPRKCPGPERGLPRVVVHVHNAHTIVLRGESMRELRAKRRP